MNGGLAFTCCLHRDGGAGRQHERRKQRVTSPARDLTAALNKAVDRLVKPRRTRLLRDGGTTIWATIPSLIAQLDAEIGTGTARREGGGSRYRTPLDLDVMELRHTIRETINDALIAHGQKLRPDTAASIRLLAVTVTAVADDDLTEWWTDELEKFARQITNTLHLNDEPQPRGIRGASCPACGADHVTRTEAGETVHDPALTITFTGHLVRAAECHACLTTFWRGEGLLALADALTRNTTHPRADSA